jgi:hypothetical protein
MTSRINVVPADDDLVELCKRIFLSGHSEGWTANQCRRDVQFVDAEKSWKLYVENGALAKAAASLSSELARCRNALRDIIGNANEAMPFGPFDCIDNTGQPYQSEAFQRALETGRKLLAQAALNPIGEEGTREP